MGSPRIGRSLSDRTLRIAVSAHHVHLSREHVEQLFGPGHELTPLARLYIDSQFACEETVDLAGPKGCVERVRVLGPTRARTQVEISRTEEFELGLDAPVRRSGDLDGTPGLTLLAGPRRLDLDEGVICAMRHIHMTPDDADRFRVKAGDRVQVSVDGERELIFGDVLIRVHADYRLEMHLDTDEANAAELPQVAEGTLVGIQDDD